MRKVSQNNNLGKFPKINNLGKFLEIEKSKTGKFPKMLIFIHLPNLTSFRPFRDTKIATKLK